MPLYLFLTIDGNGHSEIVLFLEPIKGKEEISQMICWFKELNPKWISTKVIMSDKEFTVRSFY